MIYSPDRAGPMNLTRLILVSLFLAVLAVLAYGQVQTAFQNGDVVIRGGWLFDSVSDEVRPNTGIVVRNGVILEVDANLNGRDTSATEVVTLNNDQYVLPGLFDL